MPKKKPSPHPKELEALIKEIYGVQVAHDAEEYGWADLPFVSQLILSLENRRVFWESLARAYQIELTELLGKEEEVVWRSLPSGERWSIREKTFPKKLSAIQRHVYKILKKHTPRGATVKALGIKRVLEDMDVIPFIESVRITLPTRTPTASGDQVKKKSTNLAQRSVRHLLDFFGEARGPATPPSTGSWPPCNRPSAWEYRRRRYIGGPISPNLRRTTSARASLNRGSFWL